MRVTVQIISLLLFFSAASIGANNANNSGAPRMSAQSTDIIIIGASYAKGWQTTSLAGRSVTNYGVGGEETTAVLARFEKDVVANHPSAVIIWGFINDIFRASPAELPTKIETIKSNLRRMVEIARSSEITPILATEVTIRGKNTVKDTVAGWIGALTGKRGYPEYINGHVQHVNEWLRQYASENKILLLDLQSVLAEAGGLRRKEYATDDGSHLPAAAYEALTRYAEPLLVGPKTGPSKKVRASR